MQHSDLKGMIFDIVRNSFVDGPGIRTTVFFKGCNMKCLWCHNPESQSFDQQMMFYKNKCEGCGTCRNICKYHLEKCDFCGQCELLCPHDARKICGSKLTVSEVVAKIRKDKPFYDNSGGGATFSGGECMLQIDFLEKLLKECKEYDIHTAVDTAGNVPFEYFERILPYTDLFLYDIKEMDKEKHRNYTGADNQKILRNLEKLFERNAKIWIRIPVIPGLNDSFEEMERIKTFLEPYTPLKIELLPYHSMGEHKYAALGMQERHFEKPDAQRMKSLNDIFVKYLNAKGETYGI